MNTLVVGFILSKTQMGRYFSGNPVVMTPLSNAGGMGSIPGQGTEISHAVGQLSPHASTRKPVCYN